MSDLAGLLETLFALRGYEPEPSPGGAVLRFRKGKDHVAVRVRDGRDPVPAYVAHEVAETLPALGHAVLVCLGDLGHEARTVLEKGGIDVWTREKLIHEVGKGFLEAAERRGLAETLAAFAPGARGAPPEPAAGEEVEPAAAPEPLLAAASVPEETAFLEHPPLPPPADEATSPSPTPLAAVPAAEPAAAPLPASSGLWSRPAAPRAAAPPPPPPAVPPAIPLTPTLVQVAPPAPPPPPAAPLASAEGTVLAAALDHDGAVRVGVGRLLRVDKATLELVPLHAFRYACRLEAKGAPTIPKQGLVAVDAVTGLVREVPEPVFGAVGPRAERLQALLPEVDAAPLAKRKVVEMHTQKVRVRNALGRNSLIVEDKVVRPDPRTLQLAPQGLWWLPVWRLEGQNGTLRLNAATGAVEEEKLKRAFATDAEFL